MKSGAKLPGYIGDEVAVHDIDMDEIGSCLFNGLYFVAEFEKIAGENGRGYQNLIHCCPPLLIYVDHNFIGTFEYGPRRY
jgi:hypothetical protein